jgi:hypothetical protein
MSRITTLTPFEAEAFPVTPQELESMILREQRRSASALLRYEREKIRLRSNNPGPISSWPDEQKELWLSTMARIDAILAETENFIKRLMAEVHQIRH